MGADRVVTARYDVSCAIEPTIISDLTYNEDGNMAFPEVNVYFQCAVSICMRSEGKCNEQTPPLCANDRMEHFETRIAHTSANSNTTQATEKIANSISKLRKLRSVTKPTTLFLLENKISPKGQERYTIDLFTDKIVVFDLDEERSTDTENALSSQLENELAKTRILLYNGGKFCMNLSTALLLSTIFCLSFIIVISGFVRMLWMSKMTNKLSL